MDSKIEVIKVSKEDYTYIVLCEGLVLGHVYGEGEDAVYTPCGGSMLLIDAIEIARIVGVKMDEE